MACQKQNILTYKGETIEMLKFKRENNQNDEKDNLKIIIQQLESQINKLDEKIEKNIKDTT